MQFCLRNSTVLLRDTLGLYILSVNVIHLFLLVQCLPLALVLYAVLSSVATVCWLFVDLRDSHGEHFHAPSPSWSSSFSADESL